MSDAMNNPYANNPNQNGRNGQQPQGQPEYGAYAPNQQSQGQQQSGNPNNSSNPYPSEPQTPRYFDGPNANQNPNQNGFFYASYTTGQPYGQQNSQPGTGNDNWQPISPFKLAEEWLPKKAKNAIRGTYAILGIAAVILGLALLIWPGATLKVAAIALGAYFVVSGVVRIVTAIVELGLPGGWRVLDILIGLMLSVGGGVMLKDAAFRSHACSAHHHGGRPRLDVGRRDGARGIMAHAKLRMGRDLRAAVDCRRLHRAVLPHQLHDLADSVRRMRACGDRHRRNRARIHVRQTQSQVIFTAKAIKSDYLCFPKGTKQQLSALFHAYHRPLFICYYLFSRLADDFTKEVTIVA